MERPAQLLTCAPSCGFCMVMQSMYLKMHQRHICAIGWVCRVGLPTACCSAMPTSKVRSGKRAEKRFMPVPPPIAAWMPMILESRSASASIASAK
jgi:hypothetical protein